MLSKQTLALHKTNQFNKIRFFVSMTDEITSRYDAGIFTVDYFLDPKNGRAFLEFVEIPAGPNAGSRKRLEGSQKIYIKLTPSLKQSFEQFINAENYRREMEESLDDDFEPNLLLFKNWFNSKSKAFVGKEEFRIFKETFLSFIEKVTTHTSKIFQNIQKEMENFEIAIAAQHVKKVASEQTTDDIQLTDKPHILKDSSTIQQDETFTTLKKLSRL